jgi:hypothetical protein
LEKGYERFIRSCFLPCVRSTGKRRLQGGGSGWEWLSDEPPAGCEGRQPGGAGEDST